MYVLKSGFKNVFKKGNIVVLLEFDSILKPKITQESSTNILSYNSILH